MSAPMVLALLAGTKTQTRRIIKPQPISNGFGAPGEDTGFEIPCYQDGYPPSAMLWPGENGGMLNGDAGHPWLGVDRLWVKETFCAPGAFGVHGRKLFAADPGDDAKRPRDELGKPHRWTPSIYMPRVASRITLEIIDVTAERLNKISEEDAAAEGATPSIVGGDLDHLKYRAGYQTLWESINGAGSWEKNPWVWKISFRRVMP